MAELQPHMESVPSLRNGNVGFRSGGIVFRGYIVSYRYYGRPAGTRAVCGTNERGRPGCWTVAEQVVRTVAIELVLVFVGLCLWSSLDCREVDDVYFALCQQAFPYTLHVIYSGQSRTRLHINNLG